MTGMARGTWVRRCVAGLVGCLALAACDALGVGAATDGPNAPVRAVEAPSLVERAQLFGNPERARLRISPDGRWLAWLAPTDGVMNVWVAPTEDLARARAISQERTRGIRQFFWAENSTHVVYLQDSGGDEQFHMISVAVESGQARPLTPTTGARADYVGSSPAEPDIVMASLVQRDPRFGDLVKLNVRTGQRTLVDRNDEQFGSFVTDTANIARLATKAREDGGFDLHAFRGTGRWEKIMEVPLADSATTMPITFEEGDRTFLMLSSVGRDTGALVRVDLASAEKTVIGENPRADVTGVWTHPVTNRPLAWTAEFLREEITPLDDATRADIERIRREVKGDFAVVSQTRDNAVWVLSEVSSTQPGSFWLYRRGGDPALTRVFDVRPTLDTTALARMWPVEITSRDGKTLVSYLTLPQIADPDADGRANTPVPLVLNVHGGPWARDSYGFDPEAQWMANRGYAVLQVNFRGSTGFGKAFINAGDLQWAKAMHDDLIDGVRWAEARGIAATGRTAIMGGSYGGYAALVGLTFTPREFACGVSIVGPSNLITLLNTIPPYWGPIRRQFTTRVGDDTTDEGRALLKARSPLTRVDAIERPLLIGQGANDPRVVQAESDQIVQAMQAKGIPVTYALFPDEGHGFVRPQNRLAFNAVTETFLGECLGGRVEAIGDDFEGSSLTVPVGQDGVPGVAAALEAAR